MWVSGSSQLVAPVSADSLSDSLLERSSLKLSWDGWGASALNVQRRGSCPTVGSSWTRDHLLVIRPLKHVTLRCSLRAFCIHSISLWWAPKVVFLWCLWHTPWRLLLVLYYPVRSLLYRVHIKYAYDKNLSSLAVSRFWLGHWMWLFRLPSGMHTLLLARSTRLVLHMESPVSILLDPSASEIIM